MKKLIWLAWIILMIAAATYFGYRLLADANKTVFLVGETTDGHHQIEMACGACHTSPFGGGELLQESCVSCHGAELKSANDAHPKSKFTDPRNADRLEHLEARYCVTCHQEHHRDRTLPMGVTQPIDFCFHCHQDIADERPSHRGMGFETCASAGCHNYHDNRALYEDFLHKFADEPALKPSGRTPVLAGLAQKHPGMDIVPLSIGRADHATSRDEISHAWAQSAHAQAGVNCKGCHQPEASTVWEDKPGIAVCQTCHAAEAETFFQGKHGMRLNPELPISLSPMTPALGRLPFKSEAAHRELTCNSCHGAHQYDTRKAAVESCLGCHDDEHSRNYEKSAHAQLWKDELSGAAPEGAGVSCASCHMPRIEVDIASGKRVLVNHNQNDNLRPNEKMLRSVCQSCHGLSFGIDALADPQLIKNNFSAQPAAHIESVDMVKARPQTQH